MSKLTPDYVDDIEEQTDHYAPDFVHMAYDPLKNLIADWRRQREEIERLRSFEQIAFGIINLVSGEDFGDLSVEALAAILDCWAMEVEKVNQAAIEKGPQ